MGATPALRTEPRAGAGASAPSNPRSGQAGARHCHTCMERCRRRPGEGPGRSRGVLLRCRQPACAVFFLSDARRSCRPALPRGAATSARAVVKGLCCSQLPSGKDLGELAARGMAAAAYHAGLGHVAVGPRAGAARGAPQGPGTEGGAVACALCNPWPQPLRTERASAGCRHGYRQEQAHGQEEDGQEEAVSLAAARARALWGGCGSASPDRSSGPRTAPAAPRARITGPRCRCSGALACPSPPAPRSVPAVLAASTRSPARSGTM